MKQHSRSHSGTATRPSQPFERRWATVAQTADLMSCSKQSVYRSCRKGLIPCAKIAGVGLRIDLKRLNGQLGVEDAN
jgi:hypothetical protein